MLDEPIETGEMGALQAFRSLCARSTRNAETRSFLSVISYKRSTKGLLTSNPKPHGDMLFEGNAQKLSGRIPQLTNKGDRGAKRGYLEAPGSPSIRVWNT